MTVLLAGLLLTNTLTVGAFLWMLRDQSRMFRAERAAMLDRHAVEHTAHSEETMHLLNRIQAPAVAIAQATPPSEERPYISPFDDEALAEYEEDALKKVPPEELARVGE